MAGAVVRDVVVTAEPGSTNASTESAENSIAAISFCEKMRM